MLVEIIDGMPVGYMTLKQAAEKWDIAESSARVYISDKKKRSSSSSHRPPDIHKRGNT